MKSSPSNCKSLWDASLVSHSIHVPKRIAELPKKKSPKIGKKLTKNVSFYFCGPEMDLILTFHGLKNWTKLNLKWTKMDQNDHK